MSGRKHTDQQVAQRVAAVEAVLLAGEFTRATALGLASKYGVQLRQIQRDAAKVREAWREKVSGTDRQSDRSDWLMRVRGAQARAFRAGHSMAAARLLQLEGQALGVYEPAQIEIKHDHSNDPTEMLTRLREALPMINGLLAASPEAPTNAIEADYIEVDNDRDQ